ncbi:MAG: hypothetical protein HYX90_05520 [Chloroflexi bacterium]|nr:hypothetical protein [Chloroflexota bacterium]
MPVYDYKCTCGFTFECRQTFDSKPFAVCEQCGKMAHRQLHCPPIIFKGSGFYITDQRKDNSGEKSEKPEKAKKDETGTKSESKAEPKTEAKAESKPAQVESKPKPASGAAAKSESD